MNLLFLGRHWRIKCLPRKVCIVDTDCQGCIVISLQAMEHMLWWFLLFGRSMQYVTCSCQNVISCRFGGSRGRNGTGLLRLVCWHQELAPSSFSSSAKLVSCCLQLWAPLPRREPACQVHSCWPALSLLQLAAPAPGSQRRKDTAGLWCCVFSRDMLLWVKLLGLKLWVNPGILHLERGRGQRDWMRSLTRAVVHTAQPCWKHTF